MMPAAEEIPSKPKGVKSSRSEPREHRCRRSPERARSRDAPPRALLARSAGDDIVLGCVVPKPWPPSPAKVDAEYRADLERRAGQALDEARGRLPGDARADTVVQHARSAPAGLLALADERDGTMIVVGSSSGGVLGG